MISSFAAQRQGMSRPPLAVGVGALLGLAFSTSLFAMPIVEGPIPGQPPGDPQSVDLRDTYPFFATQGELKRRGYVEEEFYLSGTATGYGTTGEVVAESVPYMTRIVVRQTSLAIQVQWHRHHGMAERHRRL